MKCAFDKDRECNTECVAYCDMTIGKTKTVHCLRLGRTVHCLRLGRIINF